jgi:PAS domain S-box-containing protein
MQDHEKSKEQLLAELTSERQQGEQDLHVVNSTFESIVRSIPDVIYRVERSGKILFINDAIRKYGYEPAELIGTNLFDIVHPDDQAEANFRINEKRTGERRTQDHELRLLTKDHHSVPVDVRENRTAMLVSAEGIYASATPQDETYMYTQGIVCDATIRLQKEEETRQADRSRVLTEAAGGAAHEIYQPLTVIVGLVEIALVEMMPTDKWRADFSEILFQAEKIKGIIDKMRNVQKYVTKSYASGKDIADFDAASQSGAEEV